VLDSSTNGVSTNGISPGSSSHVLLGSDPQYTNNPIGLGRSFAGQICEVALFTNALTASQVQTMYGLLAVTSSVNLNPTNIVVSLSGGQLVLSWPADHTGWRLQMQTNSLGVGLSTNWVSVAGTGATNQVSVSTTNASVFYRLVYP
jgi:hypothetical protein